MTVIEKYNVEQFFLVTFELSLTGIYELWYAREKNKSVEFLAKSLRKNYDLKKIGETFPYSGSFN